MATYKVVDADQLDADMTEVADAIRAKGGTSEQLVWPDGYKTAVAAITTGGGGALDTSDATATAEDIDYGETAYVNSEKLTGTKRRKEYTGEIVSTVLGSGVYAVLAQDDLLAEIRNEETLFVRVEFDIEATAYTIVKCWGVNVTYELVPINSNTNQWTYRWDGSAARGYGVIGIPLNDSDTETNVGLLKITEDGELRCYSNSSSNYAIRPSTYKVVVEW